MPKSWTPPETIFDGSMEWHVKVVDQVPRLSDDQTDDNVALTDSDAMTIYLLRSLDPSRARQKLMHELVHVIHFSLTSHRQDDDEIWTEDFSHGLMRLLEQNPDIVPRVKRRIRKPKDPNKLQK